MQIVEMDNGLYAVRKRGLLGWKYRSKGLNIWRSNPEEINDYCLMDSEEKARALVERIKCKGIKRVITV